MIKTTMMLGATILALTTACGGGAATPDAQTPGNSSGASTSTTGGAPPGEALSDLETKRMQDNINKKIISDKAKFKDECGFDVDVEIDWASFGHSKGALEALYSNVGVERLVDSFKNVCTDKTGKDAVKAKIKKIRAVCVPDKSKAKASVTGGTFTAELDWGGGWSPSLTPDDMATIITKSL